MNANILTLALVLSLLGNIFLIAELDKKNEQPEAPVSEEQSEDDNAITIPSGESYPFIRVVDGDTITVGFDGDIEYVRFIGIDSPEPNDPGGPECFATESTDHLSSLLNTGTVVLHFDGTQGLRDKHGRLLAYVELPDGTDLSAAMLRDGYAQEFTYDLPYERQALYQEAETQAQTAGRGLWAPYACR